MSSRWLASWLPTLTAAWLTLIAAGCAHRTSKSTAPTPQAGSPAPNLPLLTEPVVWIVGPVRWPVLDWHRSLTLAQALLAAEYIPEKEPRLILLHRGTVTLPIDPARLLEGEDWALLPGDRIEIQP